MPTRLRAIALVALMLGVSLVCTIAPPWRAGASPPPCGAPPDVVTSGPRLGVVSDTGVAIWLRTCTQVNVSAEYKLSSGDWSGALTTAPVATDAGADNTAVIAIAGLQAATSYDYRLIVEGQLPSTVLGGTFKTNPASGGNVFSFIATSDPHFPALQPETMFTAMAQEHAQFALLGGDQIEIESALLALGRCCFPESQADYEQTYQGLLADPAFANLVANTPTMMMWDDHEIINDWSQGDSTAPYPWARGAFNEYAASANPVPRTPGALQYTFDAGDVAVYMLDTRTFRSPDMMPDGPDKTMLGVDQKQDLENWLLTSPARFKLVYSSVMWNNFAGHTFYGESWPSFQTERNEILDFIHDHQIPGVVLLSGDEHWTGAFKLSPWGVYEIAPGPLTLGVYPTSSTDPQILFKQGGERSYSVFSVDTTVCPAKLTIRLMRQPNNNPSDQPVTAFTLPLTEMDLNGDPDGDGLPTCLEQQLGTDPHLPDTDGDGCRDDKEIGSDPLLGGQRNPLSFWDFFDTPDATGARDHRIRVDDVTRVVNRYRANDANGTAPINRNSDPLAAPPPAPAYSPAFDRGGVAGPHLWSLAPPDGQINVADVVAVVNQYRHDCA